ncbi:MAG: ribonuclease H [Muribaculaceae bacterium]
MMEYRCVRVADGEEVFHVGPLAEGTNNVAEYLALVHALALLFKQNDSATPIYTDSVTAVAWVRNRGCRTQLTPTERNKKIFEMLARANLWLRSHSPRNPILRWNTPMWGEIPADFGRK